MKFKITTLVLIMSLIMGIIFSQGIMADNLKVGLVTDTGGLNDKSFNHLAHKGLLKAEKDFPIEIGVVESGGISDFVPNLRNFAQQDYDMIIGVGFVMEDAIRKVANEYPGIKFLSIEAGIDDVDNVAAVMFNCEESAYLAGAMAGLMELRKDIPKLNEENVVGAIGGMKIPPVEAYTAGFKAGVKKVNPEAKVIINYVGNFTDQSAAKQFAFTQVSQGADIIFSATTGTGIYQAMQEKNGWAIGADTDQNYLAPDTILTSALKKVDVATYNIIEDVVNNRFKSGITYFDLSNDGVGLVSPLDVVPEEIYDRVMELKEQIINKEIEVPTTN